MPNSLPAFESECFVISPIGPEGSQERDRSDGVLEFIIGKAAEELGLSAVRSDQLAEPGQITLQVLDHVLGARAAVADLTDLNPNVFYELAVRHTARLPVALIAERGCKLPFDIAQMRTIFFDHTNLKSADQCRQEIVSHLRGALDNDAVDSPIATSVDVRALAGGSVAERNIAEIVTSVESVAKTQRSILQAIEQLRLDDTSPDSDSEFLHALEQVAGSVADLQVDPADPSSPDSARLIEQVNELNEMLRSMRQLVRRKGRRSTRPRLRSIMDGPDEASPD